MPPKKRLPESKCSVPLSSRDDEEATTSPKTEQSVVDRAEELETLRNQIRHLISHINDLTSSVELSSAHKVGILNYLVPTPGLVSSVSQRSKVEIALRPVSVKTFSAVVRCKSEALFQKRLIQSMMTCSSVITNGANCEAPNEASVKIVQVNSAVQKFSASCVPCLEHGVSHKFSVQGTIGDLHIVSNGNGAGREHNPDSESTNKFPQLPNDLAIIVELKRSSSLTADNVSQALLQLHLHQQLLCCQGREVTTVQEANVSSKQSNSTNASQFTNCLCTEKRVVVMFVWGAASCVVTSFDRETVARSIPHENAALKWAEAVHGVAARLEEEATSAEPSVFKPFSPPPPLSPEAFSDLGRSQEYVPELNFSTPLPNITSVLRNAKGQRLGSIRWEAPWVFPDVEYDSPTRGNGAQCEGMALNWNEQPWRGVSQNQILGSGSTFRRSSSSLPSQQQMSASVTHKRFYWDRFRFPLRRR